jgi:hypothetical protein
VVSAADISCVVARRGCAGLAATSAALHGVMLGHVRTPALVVLVALMVGGCLLCARELWCSGTTRAWSLVAMMNLTMVAVHLPVSGSHHLTHPAAGAAVPPSAIMMMATSLSIAEVAFAVAVLCVRSRANARAVGAAR